jgi:serine/threonine protein kinase/tetratricopeptide (TPR) repeat protein
MSAAAPDVKAIFSQALEIDSPADRAAYLDEACGANMALRGEVEELLVALSNAADFMKQPAVASLNLPDLPTPGALIGPYRLMEEIGAGGMGLVFVAEQQQPVRRKVALKVVKPGMDTRNVMARFEQERQALALMDHPNIAKVFDGGATASGRPYFVMELVRGVSITKFCDDNTLSPRQRLELCIPICHAVQHAHQKGIIHRDLTPSNILVALHDGRPVPKVIDFGIAKAMGEQLTDKTIYTGLTQMVGSPLYMSPEQAGLSSLDIDTRTDIYSLGVLLYELLTGTTPFEEQRLRKAAYDEIFRIIREEEPPKPSTRISELGRSGEPSPTNAAAGPARQMGFTLATISAQRHTEPARLSKLVSGDLDWIVMKCLEKDRARRYATANELALDIERYLAEEPVLACPPSVVYRTRKFIRRNQGPVLAACLVVLALVGGIAGTTLGLIGAVQAQHAEAEQRHLAQANEQKALAAAAAEQKAKATAEASEAETRAVLDFVETRILAAARPPENGGLGRDVALRRAIEASVPFVENSFAKQPLIEARLRTTIGLSFTVLGEPKTAAEQFEKARTLYATHRGTDHRDTLGSRNQLAGAYFSLGRRDEAVKLREETLALQKAKLGPEHRDTLVNMNSLANNHFSLRRHAEAVKLREQTLELQKAAFGLDHPDTLRTTKDLADNYASLGRPHEALKLREDLLALHQAKHGHEDPRTIAHMHILANSYGAVDRHADAAKLREKTLALQKTKFGPDDLKTLETMHKLANSYASLGRHAEALKLREERLALQKVKLPGHGETLTSMWGLAEDLVKLGRSAQAVPIIDECIKHATGKGTHPRMVPTVMYLRLRHFENAKDVAGCRATAEMWEQLNRTDASSLYDAACMRAVTAAVMRANDPTAAAVKDAATEADRAMAWLQQSVAAGFINVARIKQDNDLHVLRVRADFRKLIAALEARKRNQRK